MNQAVVDDRRAQFEEYVQSTYGFTPKRSGDYYVGAINDEWKSWQAALSAAAAAPVEMSDDEKRLRRLFCARVSGALAYMDDGEAQDGSAEPFIDFLRDGVEEIERKLRERGIRTMQAAAATSPTLAPTAG